MWDAVADPTVLLAVTLTVWVPAVVKAEVNVSVVEETTTPSTIQAKESANGLSAVNVPAVPISNAAGPETVTSGAVRPVTLKLVMYSLHSSGSEMQ